MTTKTVATLRYGFRAQLRRGVDPEEKPVLGGEYTVTIALAHPEYLGDALQKDATFDCREGPKIIGRGKVLKVEETKR